MLADVQMLPRWLPREHSSAISRSNFLYKSLIYLVGAQGLEPWTR